MKNLLLSLLIIPFFISPTFAQVGKQAPAFSLPAANGKTVDLADFKGKVLVLNFWATWCPPCRAEIPDFIKAYGSFKSKGVEILGVALDQNGWEAVKPFITKQKITYPVVLGGAEIAAEYGGVSSIPTTFIINRSGKIVDQQIGMLSGEKLTKMIEKAL
jgi:peroxiredoxin